MHKNTTKVEESSNNRVSTQPQDTSSKKDGSQKNEFMSQNNFLQNVVSYHNHHDDSMNSYGEDIDENPQQGNLNPKQIQSRFKDKTSFHFLSKDIMDNTYNDKIKSNIESQNQSPMMSFYNLKDKNQSEEQNFKDEFGIEAQVDNLQKQQQGQQHIHQKLKEQQKQGLAKKRTLPDFQKQRSIDERIMMEYNNKVIRSKGRFQTHIGISKQDSGSQQTIKQPVLYALTITDLLEIEEVISGYFTKLK